MAYQNTRFANRLVIIQHVKDVFAEIHVNAKPSGSEECYLDKSNENAKFFELAEIGAAGGSGDLYNFPFLFLACGNPWYEANDYLLSLVKHRHPEKRPTDDLRKRASKLLDYLLFCEDENLDWLDFTGARPAFRPTYKYFYHLINEGSRSNQVINQYTAVVYHFYDYVSRHWHDLDLKRVDTTKQVEFAVRTNAGIKLVKTEKRSQTKRVPPESPVPMGFVREDGEDLRPLCNRELGLLINAIRNLKDWSAVERMILLVSLMTGARKQTVLTMRLKHLSSFTNDKLLPDGSYKLLAGPRTGIDTKYDKPQDLYFPKQLAEDLVTLASSSMMKKRRAKFRMKLKDGFQLSEDDTYLFLSDQGNCYYMAKSDPRYPVVMSPQTGQVTDTLKKKLIKKLAGKPFPEDFSYHWLRATFAFQLYQRLQVLVENQRIRPGEVIDFVQKRMHHESRETTENYLKLFEMSHEKVASQEMWEKTLFNGGYDVLKVETQDE
ncbi:site-specific integrase [Pseudomonas sp. 5Ae-yellow]|uniref:site-specific integrase n=1 Tax=Pseudomonas sp. 5Ae-yellow TaxID=2759848 RepID=UPI0015F5B0B2|nr:site-specific integrase [Pseudomonas sp. 5Ae-yellow]MBA6419614.1 site-specific integrase [Pseudomonas sp. 5Ae-yellow]